MTTNADNKATPQKPIEYDPSRMTRAGYERLKQEKQAAAEAKSTSLNNEILRDLRDSAESMSHEIFRLKCLCGFARKPKRNGWHGLRR